MNTRCAYVGCSHQSVPSLSNTAIRSAGFTNAGEPGAVTFATNDVIDRFAALSFHDGKGSRRAQPVATFSAHTSASKPNKRVTSCLRCELQPWPVAGLFLPRNECRRTHRRHAQCRGGF